MNIYINNAIKNLPDNIDTLGKVVDFLNIPRKGTGIAVNGKLVKAADWDKINIKNEDHLTIISATYGG